MTTKQLCDWFYGTDGRLVPNEETRECRVCGRFDVRARVGESTDPYCGPPEADLNPIFPSWGAWRTLDMAERTERAERGE